MESDGFTYSGSMGATHEPEEDDLIASGTCIVCDEPAIMLARVRCTEDRFGSSVMLCGVCRVAISVQNAGALQARSTDLASDDFADRLIDAIILPFE